MHEVAVGFTDVGTGKLVVPCMHTSVSSTYLSIPPAFREMLHHLVVDIPNT